MTMANFPYRSKYCGGILMRNVSLFVEDFGHQEVISAFVERYGREYGVELIIHPYNVRGGKGKMVTELKQYVRDLSRADGSLPDLLIVGCDANCKGIAECRRGLESGLGQYSGKVVYAIPDPHIERWLLLDSAAFKIVLGRGCAAPDHKCERDRYKNLLLNAVRAAGLRPLIGGIEHAEAIIQEMDLQRMMKSGDSLGDFLEELRTVFGEWMSVASQ